MDNKKTPKNPKKFECNICYFITSNKKDFYRHLSTDKHKNSEMDNKMDNEDNEKNPTSYTCDCGNIYRYKSGLCKHKKLCKLQEITITKKTQEKNEKDDIFMLTNIVLEVVKQNKELMAQQTENQKQTQEITCKLLEMCQNGITNNSINTINSHNKTFNLNVFLNETCKDAMNIMDFVDSVKIQLSDLENVGKMGFIEGISNIIIKNLKALEVHQRPVHCSDSKREVMYVKDDNKWEKENSDKKKLRKAIKYIAHKNSKMLPEFKAKYPDCGKSESKYVDQYNKLVIEAMGGKGDNELEKEDKIIRRIAKEVIIDK
jgi:hypothetical protein